MKRKILVWLCAMGLLTVQVSAQEEGPLFPSVGENNAATGDVAWSDPENASANDGNNAVASIPGGQTSQYLFVKDLGFALPEGAIMNGVVVRIEKSKSAGNIKDSEVKLLVNGVPAGDDRSSIDGWPASVEVEEYGSDNDLWGVALTADDVNAAGFGLALRAFNDGGAGPAREARIDYISIVIHYSVPLPITLKSFDAHLADDHKVKLTWTTVAEINNDYFTLERSRNGMTFSEVGRVKGSGNSNRVLDYEFVDDAPMKGTSYYRLKQTDFNGDFELFKMVAINFDVQEDGTCVLKVMPNPCIGTCTVNLSECKNNEQSPIQVEMMDASGRRVYSTVPSRQSDGSFSFSVDTHNNLKPGIYVVTGRSASEAYSQKIIAK